MSNIPEDLKYTGDHEWIRLGENFIGTCGITDHAQEMLTDIVFVELPEIGTEVKAGEQIALVESVKAASDVYSPVMGEIVEVNSELMDSPELINSDPYGKGWIFKIDVKSEVEVDGLMDANEYNEYLLEGD